MTWPLVALDEICEPQTGTRDPRSEPARPFTYVDIGSVDNKQKRITEPKTLPGADAPSRARRLIEANDVIISMTRPNLNAVAVVPDWLDSQICSTGFAVLRANGKLLPEYLFHFTTSARFIRIASGAVSGAMYPAITERFLRSIEIPLPPLDEQRCIVDILNRANGILRLRREALDKTRQLIPALFVKMFGDPATNPRRLRKAPIGEVIKVRSGTFLPGKSMAAEGRYPVYGGNGVNGYHSEYLFEDPVIVIGRVGAQCGNVHLSAPQCWVTDNALYVAEQSADLDEVYLASALRRANLNQRASQSGQPLISGGRIYPVEILIPPVERQRAFGSRVADIQATIAQQERMAKASEQLVAALMARLFHGAPAKSDALAAPA